MPRIEADNERRSGRTKHALRTTAESGRRARFLETLTRRKVRLRSGTARREGTQHNHSPGGNPSGPGLEPTLGTRASPEQRGLMTRATAFRHERRNLESRREDHERMDARRDAGSAEDRQEALAQRFANDDSRQEELQRIVDRHHDPDGLWLNGDSAGAGPSRVGPPQLLWQAGPRLIREPPLGGGGRPPPSRLLRCITRSVTKAIEDGRARVLIQLKSPGLEGVTVDIRADGDCIDCHFSGCSARFRREVENTEAELRFQLRTRGLRLGVLQAQ